MIVADELADLLDAAIYKEIASRALYEAGRGKTTDPGAATLMRELASQELGHSRRLQKLRDVGHAGPWRRDKVHDLRIGNYLSGPDLPEGSGLQDLLIFAMKREQESIDFYTGMMAALGDEPSKRLCESLVRWELRHKLRLELMYDELFYREN